MLGTQKSAGRVILPQDLESRIVSILEICTPDENLEGEENILLKVRSHRSLKVKKNNSDKLNDAYSTLQALGVPDDDIKIALEKTYGYNVKAALEWICCNRDAQHLSRSLGGDLAALKNTNEAIEEDGSLSPVKQKEDLKT